MITTHKLYSKYVLEAKKKKKNVVALVMFYDDSCEADSVCVAIKWTGLGVIKTFEYNVRAVRACKCIWNDQPAALFHLLCLGVFFGRAAADALHGAGGKQQLQQTNSGPSWSALEQWTDWSAVSLSSITLTPGPHTENTHRM